MYNNDLSNKVPFSFGIDSNGNYGYKKVGADTVYPFNSGSINIIVDALNIGTSNKSYTIDKLSTYIVVASLIYGSTEERLGYWIIKKGSIVTSKPHASACNVSLSNTTLSIKPYSGFATCLCIFKL